MHLNRKRVVTGLISLAVFLAIIASMVIADRQEDKPEETKGSLEERFAPTLIVESEGKQYGYKDWQTKTVLIIGVDSYGLQSETSTYRGGAQADFLMLLSVDREEKTVKSLHIERDTITDIDVYGILGNPMGRRKTQLCLAQGFGNSIKTSTQNTVSAVSRLLNGIPVDYYIVFDTASVNALNDLLGGVMVTLQDDLTMLDPQLRNGATVTLQGNQAELFVRGRMNVADGTNANRMRRQRTYIDSAVEKAREYASENPAYFENLIEGLEGFYYSNLSRSELVGLLNRISSYTREETLLINGKYAIGKDGFREFYADTESLNEKVLELCFQEIGVNASNVVP